MYTNPGTSAQSPMSPMNRVVVAVFFASIIPLVAMSFVNYESTQNLNEYLHEHFEKAMTDIETKASAHLNGEAGDTDASLKSFQEITAVTAHTKGTILKTIQMQQQRQLRMNIMIVAVAIPFIVMTGIFLGRNVALSSAKPGAGMSPDEVADRLEQLAAQIRAKKIT